MFQVTVYLIYTTSVWKLPRPGAKMKLLRLDFPALKPSVLWTLYAFYIYSQNPYPSLPNPPRPTSTSYISLLISQISQPCLPSSIANPLCSLLPPITMALWQSNWTRPAMTSDPSPTLLLRSGLSDPTPNRYPRRWNGSRLADQSMPALTVLRMWVLSVFSN